mgnify:CR=1 FL=1
MSPIEVHTPCQSNTAAKVQNLLTKGSLNHLTHQLKKTSSQHFSDIKKTLSLASDKGIETNIHLQREIMNDGGFQDGGRNIHYLEERLEHLV